MSRRSGYDLSELKHSKQISSSYIVTNYADSENEGIDAEYPNILASTYEKSKKSGKR